MIPCYTSTYDYTLGLFRVAIDLPYRDGVRNLQKALGWPSSNEVALQQLGSKMPVEQPGTFERTFSFIVGAALLVPVANVAVDVVMRLIFHSFVPHHALDLKEVSDPSIIRGRLSKARRNASWQRWWQWSSWAFDRALSNPKLVPGLHTKSYTIDGHSVGFAELQGRRPTMEDRHLATHFGFYGGSQYHKVNLYGIFDGHGGDGASHFVAGHLKSYLSHYLKKYAGKGLTDAAVYQALRSTCVDLDRYYGGEAGTTASFAFTIDGDLWTANVGDARVVLKNGNSSWPFFGYSAQQLTTDLKPTDSSMRKGIEKRGGIVFGSRINGCLAVARAIGDWALTGFGRKKCVSPLPKVVKVPKEKIAAGSELILACDGLWDVASSNQVVKGVYGEKRNGKDNKDAAKSLAQAAYNAGSGDNISVMVVSL